MSTTGQSSAGWHRIASFMRCPQEYTYCYLYGIKSKEARPAPALGTAVHALLATYYSRDKQHMKELARFEPTTVAKAKEIMRRLLGDPVLPREEVISVEQEYEIYIGDRYRFTRRLDLVFALDGRVNIQDHKTAGDIDRRYKTAKSDLSLATQVLVGQRYWGKKFKQFWLYLISTTEEKQVCVPITFGEAFIDNVNSTLLHYLRQIDEFQADMFKAPRTWHCRVGPHTCDYWALCSYGPSALAEFEIDDDYQLTSDIQL